MDSVVHFEMPYDDRKRMAKFYQAAFGWKTQETGEEMGNYVLATTVEPGAERAPSDTAKSYGAINGGFYRRNAEMPGQNTPSVVISVGDIKAAMKKVQAAGGTVHGEPMKIPGVGQYVAFTDPENNRLSMLQPIARE